MRYSQEDFDGKASLWFPLSNPSIRLHDGRDHYGSRQIEIGSTTEIDVEYQRRVDAMSIKEKVERSAAMFAWTRQQMASRIRQQSPELTDEQVKWHEALKLYESEPAVTAMIQGHLINVSR